MLLTGIVGTVEQVEVKRCEENTRARKGRGGDIIWGERNNEEGVRRGVKQSNVLR